MASFERLDSGLLVHRVGGCDVPNLRLKDRELELDPPGISVFAADTPEFVAQRIREEFPCATRLIEASRVIASATIQAIRGAGFDVISDPTRRFENHARLIHPRGAAGFSEENLAILASSWYVTAEE